MMYVGTEDAKILTFTLSELYANPVSKATVLKKVEADDMSEESLEHMLKKNEEQLASLMKEN